MSRDNNDNLPSYKDFLEKPSDDLPSLEEVLEENLPSVNDFLPSQVEEETQTIENSDGDSFLEVTDVVRAPEWSELVRLVNDVRKDIPQIPEIKSYDDELEGICSQIEQIQTNFSLLDAKSDKITDLSAQNEEFEVKLTEIESKIPEVPEVRYYEEDIRFIHDKITRIRDDINNLPEVKYYENDLDALKSRIEEVNEAIPTFPDWVQEVQEVPDFSWIGKTFSLIDDDFNKVQGHLDIIREKIDYQVNELNDTVEKKEFDLKVDINNLNNSLNDTNIYLGETKDKIYKEIKDSSVRIWEHHKEFKDDDRKLKKAILSEQNKLKQSLQKEIKDINEKSVKADESILKFFTDLKETVDTLPEVKYYDRDISKLRKDLDTTKEDLDITKDDIKDLVSELNQIATTIKEQQELISEGYLLNEPPEEKQTAGNQTDPLTPLDQKFATLKDLSAHYRLFVNRIQTQLAAIGGGGAGFIRDLDDVNFDATAGNGQLLIWDSPNSRWVGIDSNKVGRVGAAGTWGVDSVGIHTIKSVGIGTTARSGFTLYVEGDQYVDGNITVGGTITYEDVKNVDSVGLVTARTGIRIGTTGLGATVGPAAGAGIITYFGDGSQLTGIIGGVGIQSGSARIGVGFTDINFTGTGVTVVGSGSTVVIDIPATTIRRQVETASGITTDFTITDGYTSGFIDVYLNGVKQRDGTDFTASNGTTVTMVPHINDGDVLEFQIYENLTVASGGGGESYTGTSGQILQHNGSKYVGVSSVGLATFFNDHHQGYYRYSTHYYSSGIANTVQTLPSDEFVMIQPSVRTNRFEYLPEKMLEANSNNPWVGTAATIGTGQTEFSLAGLDEGSTVIVRIASQFNPDIDYTNVDFSLNFTTNPTTQSFGTTSFSIVREQGLICNEGADQNYLSETLINFYVGSSLSGLTTADAGTFNMSVRASEGGEFEMLALTVNVVA